MQKAMNKIQSQYKQMMWNNSCAQKRTRSFFVTWFFGFWMAIFFSRELVEFVPWLTASFLLASQLEAQNRRGPWTLGRLPFRSCSDRRSHWWGHQHIEGIGGEERSSAGPVCCVLELVKSTNWRWEKLVTIFNFFSIPNLSCIVSQLCL